jgi:hypothetical protein
MRSGALVREPKMANGGRGEQRAAVLDRVGLAVGNQADVVAALVGCKLDCRASIPQGSFCIGSALGCSRQCQERPSNRPHRFIDFLDENWLCSVFQNWLCSVFQTTQNCALREAAPTNSPCGRSSPNYETKPIFSAKSRMADLTRAMDVALEDDVDVSGQGALRHGAPVTDKARPSVRGNRAGRKSFAPSHIHIIWRPLRSAAFTSQSIFTPGSFTAASQLRASSASSVANCDSAVANSRALGMASPSANRRPCGARGGPGWRAPNGRRPVASCAA